MEEFDAQQTQPMPAQTRHDDTLATAHTPQTSQAETPLIGGVDRTIFSTVFMMALFVLAVMVTMISKGAIALAVAVPVPFTVQAGTLTGRNFRLYPGISQADHSTPVGINQMDCTISNLAIIKQVSLPIVGNVTMTLKSGDSTPATLNGLTTDISSLGTTSANFNSLAINTNANGNAFEIDSNSTVLSGANINSPYLVVNSITLPNLSFSLGK